MPDASSGVCDEPAQPDSEPWPEPEPEPVCVCVYIIQHPAFSILHLTSYILHVQPPEPGS